MTLPACFVHINSDDGVQYRRVLGDYGFDLFQAKVVATDVDLLLQVAQVLQPAIGIEPHLET